MALKRSEARQFLSRLTEAYGTDGVLIVPKSAPGDEGGDLVPGSGLRWPPCRCGQPVCPDYRPPGSAAEPSADEPGAGELGTRVAERNKRSSRGGV